jgi:outer membrane protein TolC
MPVAPMKETDQPLPINLATALRLSDARPLLIAAAQARVQIAAGKLDKAKVLWLPNLNAGVDYIRTDGGNQNVTGALVNQGTNTFYGGGSLEFRVATTDAIFAPLAARQDLRARNYDVQTAKNEALLQTAEAYFTVQESRGVYAAMTDTTEKARDLVKRVKSLAASLAPQDEIERANTLLAALEQQAVSARQQWRVSSAQLTRVLRLNPATTVMPLEPDHLQITLIAPETQVDGLIPIGLLNRPELASTQAAVQASQVRVRQEQYRPFIPTVLITGNGTPDFFYQESIFATGPNGGGWAGRTNVSAQLVWKAENLGLGNRALIRERRGEEQLAHVELQNTQDTVAAQVVQAQADVESAAIRVGQAEMGLKQSLLTFEGNLKGLGQTSRFGDVLVLVNRPQEVVAALQLLERAYINYYHTVADYNRSQFRLYWALGFPAGILACERSPGEQVPVDTSRPPYLPPVITPQP